MQRNHLFHWIFQTGILAVVGGLIFSAVMIIIPSSASSAAPASLVHLRLLDRLDRPEDGYCVDILGTPGNLRVDVPLFAHNCKTSLTDDSAVVLSSDGYIKFPATELCITVAGVNSVALPGTSILLRKCDESISFFNTSNLQRLHFTMTANLQSPERSSAWLLGLTQQRLIPQWIVGVRCLSMIAPQSSLHAHAGSSWFLRNDQGKR